MKEITTDEVKKRLNDPNINIVDVREDFEVNLGMIPGAKHIPLGELPERFHELDQHKKHIIVCRSGGRSEVATHFLGEQGYEAYNLVGGMLDWDGEIE